MIPHLTSSITGILKDSISELGALINIISSISVLLITEAIFLMFVFMTIVGGVIAIWARALIRAVFGLALCLIGVAGLYYYLGSPFMALMEILIYVGAVCVVITFAIMLSEPLGYPSTYRRGAGRVLWGLLASLPLALLLTLVVRRASWVPALTRSTDSSVAAVGKLMLLDYGLVFELISVILLLAIVGSIILAWGGRESEQLPREGRKRGTEQNE